MSQEQIDQILTAVNSIASRLGAIETNQESMSSRLGAIETKQDLFLIEQEKLSQLLQVNNRELADLNHRVDAIEQRLGQINQNLFGINNDIRNLQQEVGTVRQRINAIDRNVDMLRLDFGSLRGNQPHTVRGQLDRIESSISAIEERVKNLESR